MSTMVRTEGEIELNLIRVVARVLRGRRLIAVTTLVGVVLGVLLILTSKPYYAAKAVFLPPKNMDMPATGIMFFGTGGDQSDLYLGLLASDAVEDDVIEHLGLMQMFHPKLRQDARQILAGMSKFTVDKNTMVTVTVKAGKPELAAAIANAYLEALYRLNGKMVASASEHRRSFYEDQLSQQKAELLNAEVALEQTEQKTGTVSPTGEAQAQLEATAQLQAQINQVQTRLAGLLVSETEQNAQVKETRSELAQLQVQQAQLQSAAGKSARQGLAAAGALPAMALENGQRQREVKLRETVYDALVQQYERARLQSLDPGPQLQIVDLAMPPERKAGPSKRLMLFVPAFLGFMLGLAWVVLADPVRRFVHTVRTIEHVA